MKEIYSQEEMERILKSSVEIPDSVEQKINDTYRDLGLRSRAVLQCTAHAGRG